MSFTDVGRIPTGMAGPTRSPAIPAWLRPASGAR